MPQYINEAWTRQKIIDPQLEWAGLYPCDHYTAKIEILVDKYYAEPWYRVRNYCLCCENRGGIQCTTTSNLHHTSQLQCRSDSLFAYCEKCVLKNCHLETSYFTTSLNVNLCQQPLDMFGADAMKRRFNV